jgi:hypothetical protein
MNRVGNMGPAVAGDSSGRRELRKKRRIPAASRVTTGVNLGIAALQIGVRVEGGAAVAGPGDEQHVDAPLADQPVQMDVNEVEDRASCPSGPGAWA